MACWFGDDENKTFAYQGSFSLESMNRLERDGFLLPNR
jgi:hypothetical protein